VYKRILIDEKFKTGRRGKNRAEWEKSIKEENVPHWTVVPSKEKKKKIKKLILVVKCYVLVNGSFMFLSVIPCLYTNIHTIQY